MNINWVCIMLRNFFSIFLYFDGVNDNLDVLVLINYDWTKRKDEEIHIFIILIIYSFLKLFCKFEDEFAKIILCFSICNIQKKYVLSKFYARCLLMIINEWNIFFTFKTNNRRKLNSKLNYCLCISNIHSSQSLKDLNTIFTYLFIN